MKPNQRIFFFLVVSLAALLLRVVPHAPNIALLGALSLTAGYYLKEGSRYWLPLGTAFLSDLIIGVYSWPIMASVYLSYTLAIFVGSKFKKNLKSNFNGWLMLGSLLSSSTFFLITNGAVWLWSGMYQLTATGLMQSYVNALPFFRNSLLSDFYGTVVLISSFMLISRLLNSLQATPSQTNTEHV